ncbi:MAG: restriction endonuclease [Methylomonas sp.]|jgi:restriction system protein
MARRRNNNANALVKFGLFILISILFIEKIFTMIDNILNSSQIYFCKLLKWIGANNNAILLLFFIVSVVFLCNYLIQQRRNKINRENLSKFNDSQIKNCWDTIIKHIQELSIKKKQLVINDGYGIKNATKWEKEKGRFFEKVMFQNIDHAWALNNHDVILRLIDDEVDKFIIKFNNQNQNYSEDCTPIEYEHLCANYLKIAGWEANTTSVTGDQGADIIALKQGSKVVIQCKKYSQPVGNKAVQEAHAAKSFYEADKAIVVSNASYTTSAKQIAGKLGVLLLHHDDLTTFKL